MIDISVPVLTAALGSFADDTRVWKSIKTKHDSFLLQTDLNGIYHWSTVNNMKFNDDKFEVLSFGLKEFEAAYKTPSNAVIDGKSIVKDLGILFNCTLSFKEHILQVVSKGTQLAGWFLRSFKTRKMEDMKTVLQSLIIPKMEYGSVIWSPTDVAQINFLESVQRRFTSYMSCFQTYDATLNMTT